MTSAPRQVSFVSRAPGNSSMAASWWVRPSVAVTRQYGERTASHSRSPRSSSATTLITFMKLIRSPRQFRRSTTSPGTNFTRSSVSGMPGDGPSPQAANPAVHDGSGR